LTNPFERIPVSIDYTKEHHGITTRLRRNGRPRPGVFAPALLFALVVCLILDVTALLVLIVLAIVVETLLTLKYVWQRRQTLAVRVSDTTLRIGSQSFPLRQIEASVCDGAFVVVDQSDEVSVERRFADFGSEAELRWLLEVISYTRRLALVERRG
jgi:hypothetical protein